MSATPTVLVRPCPTCGRAAKLSPDNPDRPFCSERCRLIDLGEWVAGRRGLPVEGDGADDSDADAPRYQGDR